MPEKRRKSENTPNPAQNLNEEISTLLPNAHSNSSSAWNACIGPEKAYSRNQMGNIGFKTHGFSAFKDI
jgi:hypothetical protein